MAELEPTPEQLSSPRGAPLTALSWADVRTRVAEADDFLLATADPDGRPHVVPVLAVWLEGTVCFVTFRQARKARNLERNNGCAVTVPGHDVDLVLEGAAHRVRNAARLQRIADLFPAKYPWWHPIVRDGEVYDPADTALSDPRHASRSNRRRCSHSVRRKGSPPPAGASNCSDRTWPRTPSLPKTGATRCGPRDGTIA